jgi:hypothetical protein
VPVAQYAVASSKVLVHGGQHDRISKAPTSKEILSGKQHGLTCCSTNLTRRYYLFLNVPLRTFARCSLLPVLYLLPVYPHIQEKKKAAREKKLQYLRERYKKNRQERLQEMREYYQQNKQKILDDLRTGYQNKREQKIHDSRLHRQKNRERILLYEQKYRQKNREKIILRLRAQYKKNRESRLLYLRDYRDKTREKILLQKKSRGLPLPRRYASWNSISEVRNFFLRVAESYHVKSWPDDWYRISLEQVHSAGGK